MRSVLTLMFVLLLGALDSGLHLVSAQARTGLSGPAAGDIQRFLSSRRDDFGGPVFRGEATVAYGDFNGDGRNDAIGFFYVALEGGNSVDLLVASFRNEGARFVLNRVHSISEVFGGQPRRITFSPGAVEVTMTVPRPGDPRCCPTGERRFRIATGAATAPRAQQAPAGQAQGQAAGWRVVSGEGANIVHVGGPGAIMGFALSCRANGDLVALAELPTDTASPASISFEIASTRVQISFQSIQGEVQGGFLSNDRQAIGTLLSMLANADGGSVALALSGRPQGRLSLAGVGNILRTALSRCHAFPPPRSPGGVEAAPSAASGSGARGAPFGTWVYETNGRCSNVAGAGVIIAQDRLIVDHPDGTITYDNLRLVGCRGDVCTFTRPGARGAPWSTRWLGPDRIVFRGPGAPSADERVEARREGSSPGCQRAR